MIHPFIFPKNCYQTFDDLKKDNFDLLFGLDENEKIHSDTDKMVYFSVVKNNVKTNEDYRSPIDTWIALYQKDSNGKIRLVTGLGFVLSPASTKFEQVYLDKLVKFKHTKTSGTAILLKKIQHFYHTILLSTLKNHSLHNEALYYYNSNEEQNNEYRSMYSNQMCWGQYTDTIDSNIFFPKDEYQTFNVLEDDWDYTLRRVINMNSAGARNTKSAIVYKEFYSIHSHQVEYWFAQYSQQNGNQMVLETSIWVTTEHVNELYDLIQKNIHNNNGQTSFKNFFKKHTEIVEDEEQRKIFYYKPIKG